VRAARSADVTIVFVGGSSARDFDTQFKETGAAETAGSISDMEAGEGFDRSSLELMGLQQQLLEALKATGKPLVVVYIEGRPLDKRWAKDNADVLFGDYNPAGRLPVSVPLSVGQLPVYYNQPTPAPGDYIDLSSKPLYSFGYGLSFTEFSYGAMRCEPQAGGGLKVTVTVTNAGSRDGDDVVQVYVTDPVASTVRPRLQLRGFARENFRAGETRDVEILLDAESFPEPGEFIIRCGPSSDNLPLKETIVL
jgi:beta-glucosidase